MINIQPAIKWSGSKRSQSATILNNAPLFNRYFEPFVGGGSVAYAVSPNDGVCGDICEPLIGLWKAIQSDYETLYEQYKMRWERLQNESYLVFYEIRDSFNESHDSSDLLFFQGLV